MFVLREACLADEDAILELAVHLNSINLPPDRDYIRDLLEASEKSFAGTDPDAFVADRKFLFALLSPSGQVVGTSALHAQHGTHDEPHVFFRVEPFERFAEVSFPERPSQPIFRKHMILQMGWTYEGPTEVGGLVLHPDYRGHPDKLGKLLSLGRFAYIAGRRKWFRDRVLAELLPPLSTGEDGRTHSPLWDALGKKFTGLSYDEADALSRVDKQFIHRLFLHSPICASLLPEAAQAVIGRVGKNSMGAMRLLRSIGFRDSSKIDPFDGGPHFEGYTDNLELIRHRAYRVPKLLQNRMATEPTASAPEGNTPVKKMAIVGRFFNTAPHFRAVSAPVLESVGGVSPSNVGLSADCLEALHISDCSNTGIDTENGGESGVWVCPLPESKSIPKS